MDGLFPDELTTDRLRLEPVTTETVDVQRYYEILSDDPGIEAVAEYTPWSPHETPKETADFLESVAQRRREGENAEWALRPVGDAVHPEDGDPPLAGVVGLSPDWERRSGDLGVWLRRRYWGDGLGGEAADRMLPVAFEHLDLDLVTAAVRPGNEKSVSAFDAFVDRHGGRVVGPLRNEWLDLDGTVHDELRYEVARAECERSR